MRINYLHQIKGFWITQEINQLGTSEIAMYFYLLEIWNKTGWIGCFKRNNYKVMADLSIKSYKTLQSQRDKLQAAGILKFKQKNGEANVEYMMADLSIFYQGSGEGSGKGLVQGSGEGVGKENINQTEPNIIPSSEPEGSPPKNPDPKKKKKEKEKPPPTEHWQALVKVWFDFNIKEFGDEPSLTAPDCKSLKHILERLKKRAEKASVEWSEKNAVHRFSRFLDKAFTDKWLSANFLLSNLEKQFDKIILNHSNGSSKGHAAGNNGKTAGAAKQKGGTISDLQALKRGAAADAGQGNGDPGASSDHERAEWAEAEVLD